MSTGARCWVTFLRKGGAHNGAQATDGLEVELPDGTARAIRLESTLWWVWLETATVRSFAYPIYDAQVGYIRGFMTVRKEQRERGSDYWGAYRRVGGRLRKIYLGRSVELTQRQLAAIAERFLTLEAPAGQAPKEVMPGQASGASFSER